MSKDKVAQVTIRDLHKMTKREVRSLTRWLRTSILTLEHLTAKDQAWLVKRKEYAPLFRFSLMR
jgi:hypothetical protein